MLELTSSNINKIFMNCLFKDEEIKGKNPKDLNHVPVKGIMTNVGFHPERLESHREEVKELLSQLPEAFFKSKGGGWSFLNMPMNNKNEQWGEQRTAEQLLLIGMGLGLAEIQLPREMWSSLPGCVPYICVNV